MFITGPDVIKTVTHEEVTKEDLGGALAHAQKSGVAHFAADDEQARIAARSASCSRSCRRTTPRTRRSRPATTIRRAARSRARHDGARRTRTSPTTSRRSSARSSTTALLRGAGALRAEHRRRLRAHRRAAGRHRRQPAGGPRRRASTSTPRVKAARFVRFCDCFNIPLVTFVDVPGFLPGHRPGVRRHHQARREAALRVRRGDGARRSRSSRARPTAAPTTSWRRKHIRADVNFAYPTAEIAVMGPEGAVNIVFRNELAKAADAGAERAPAGRRVPREVRQPVQGRRARLHRRGHPPASRLAAQLIRALEMLKDKRQENPPRKHGNIPL